eukprot:snap_masked-scaffold_39-processed-gene-1.47-mRNA-1 protein AED:1.00 eAED:1.00 QI:0/-1/0/0/-1/1/1/0/137
MAARCSVLYQNFTPEGLQIFSESPSIKTDRHVQLSQAESKAETHNYKLKLPRCSREENYLNTLRKGSVLVRTVAEVNNISFGDSEFLDRVAVQTNRSNLQQELLIEHISYLSSFYPNICFKALDFDKLKKHLQELKP